LGAYGVSSGGHLTLVLATSGDGGDPGAADPVDRYPCRIAAAVAVSPPTDLSGWADHPPAPLRRYPAVLRRLAMKPGPAADASPVYRVTPGAAPTLLVHGDCDDLVPVEHSRAMAAAISRAGVLHRFVEVRGAGHTIPLARYAGEARAWFEEMLRPASE
jgi:dipeptidyl aminopeptidase/acylaminoacyl peptidase